MISEITQYIDARGKRCARVEFEEGVSLMAKNRLRRALLTEPHGLAPDHVRFYSNDSAFADVIISHRIGLVPLASHVQDGDMVSIEEEGAKLIFASALKLDSNLHAVAEEHHHILLLLLDENQKISLDAKVCRGRAWEHARFKRVVAPRIDGEGVLHFETISRDDDPEALLAEAMEAVESAEATSRGGSG